MRPPLRNLSPMSEPWGRWIEGEVSHLQRQADSLGLDASNDGRANNASLDQLAAQINELYARRVITMNAADMSVPSTQNISLPTPDTSRSAWVTVSGQAYTTAPTFSSLDVYYRLNGQVFFQNFISTIQQSNPRTWVTFTASIGFTASPGAPGVVQIETATNSPSNPPIFRNIQVSIGYAQRA